jgi:hypothetical protein
MNNSPEPKLPARDSAGVTVTECLQQGKIRDAHKPPPSIFKSAQEVTDCIADLIAMGRAKPATGIPECEKLPENELKEVEEELKELDLRQAEKDGQAHLDKRLVDPEEVKRALAAMIEPGSIFEIRVPKAQMQGKKGPWKTNASGYFDDIDKCVAELNKLNGIHSAEAIYVTLNPVHHDPHWIIAQ